MRISDWSSDVCSSDLYPDGTTDVTRTIAIGEPSAEMRRRFTLVLKGHIALARARFPKDTTGSQLDAVARYARWQEGLDYDHGTGHCVGSYLNVHEGPTRISMLPNSVALGPGRHVATDPRSEERRLGKECVKTRRPRGSGA